MELRQIESFLSVAETLHFGRSSRQLHLSQPALSLQIKALEAELGVKLFDRNRQRTLLTEAGIAFREDASFAMERLLHAKERANLAGNGKLGKLHIGFISTAGSEIVPSLLRRYRKEHPHVEFALRNVLTSEQVEMVRNGALDAGFLRLPIGDHPDLEVTPVHREPFVVAVPRSHPLASSKQVRLKHLGNGPFIMYERRFAPGFHDQIAGMLSKAGIVAEIAQTAGEMPTLVSLIESEMGVAILPRSALNRCPTGVKICAIMDKVPVSEIAMVSARPVRSAVAQQFLSFALSTISKVQ